MSGAPPPSRVLVADDDESIRELVVTALDFVGYETAQAADGVGALAQVTDFHPDLIVLDVTMPGLDGTEVCRRLRAGGDLTPVIFLTARDTAPEMLAGFESGADDYLTKPFHLKVLVARIEAVLRRTQGGVPRAERFVHGDVVLDERAHRVERAGREVVLSPTEFKLLRYLLVNDGQVLSKMQIADHIWQYDFGGDPNLVETHMSALRRKLGEPRMIQTVRGVGYVLRGG